jgi:hypothetical protein
MVVLALLTLFAVLGLTFILYAESEARGAQVTREAENVSAADITPTTLMNYALGQLIFDCDSVNGIYSGLRGNSFSRSMYGYNDLPASVNGNPFNNRVPFNGTGRIHTSNPGLPDDYYVINYTYFPNEVLPAFGNNPIIFDPERLGPRNPSTTPETTNQYYGFNVPYTYPDFNNIFLASLQPNGTLNQPSFHRNPVNGTNWSPFGSLDPSNPLWYGDVGPSGPVPGARHLVLRPRPVDQLLSGESWPPNRPYFPPPADANGDVKNLVNAPGGNDSFWIDLDFPVQSTPSGQLFKPLFAFLIVDLDGRVNVNVHGNIRGPGNGHASNQGWGPWTVNLNTVLNLTGSTQPAEVNPVSSLFAGAMLNKNFLSGRYGLDQQPAAAGTKLFPPFGPPSPVAQPIRYPHLYSMVDWTGNSTTALTATGQVTRQGGSITQCSCFPGFPAGSGANFPGFGQATTNAELVNHPALFNPYLPGFNPDFNSQTQPSPYCDDRYFSTSNEQTLLTGAAVAAQPTGQPLPTGLMQLLPVNLNSSPRQNLVTTLSFDYDRPGITPYLNATSAGTFDYAFSTPPTAKNPVTYPTAGPVAPPLGASINAPGEFASQTDWRSLSAALGKLDLNRSLPDYPAPGNNNWTNNAQFQAATQARQDFARDIFTCLTAATMGIRPDYYANFNWVSLDPTSSSKFPITSDMPQYGAAQWLAQLAVNIVDYIDTDDIATAFFWNPSDWSSAAPPSSFQYVVGTEIPRLAINELYVEWDIPPTPKKTVPPPAPTQTNVRVWAELYNPMPNDPSLSNNGQAQLYNSAIPALNGSAATPIYQFLICTPGTGDRIRFGTAGTNLPVSNSAGNLPSGQVYKSKGGNAGAPCGLVMYQPPGDLQAVTASNGGLGANPPGAAGYYVIGPQTPSGQSWTPDRASSAINSMKYPVQVSWDTNAKAWKRPNAPTFVAQRLACPYLPASSLGFDVQKSQPLTAVLNTNTSIQSLITGQTPFNPYVTIDYFENACWDRRDGNFYVAAGNGVTSNKGGGQASQPQSDARLDPYVGLFTNANSYVAAAPTTNTRQLQSMTFGKINFPNGNFLGGRTAFSWLTHLDRALVNPMELLCVSAVPPAALTQEFNNAGYGGNRMTQPPLAMDNRRAPWFDEDLSFGQTGRSHRLYRFFELVGTRSQFAAAQAPVTVSTTKITVNNALPVPQVQTVVPQSMVVQTTGGVSAQIKPGDVVIIDNGLSTQENVRVLGVSNAGSAVTPNSFTAAFFMTHAAGATITLTNLGDRVPGKINLNGVWYEYPKKPGYNYSTVFEALTDPQASNSFVASGNSTVNPPFDNVDSTFNQFLQLRSPNQPLVSPLDMPLQGMATGLAAAPVPPAQFGVAMWNSTLFQTPPPNSTSIYPNFTYPPPVQAPNPPTPPYTQFEMLGKVYNNVTPRSNVFAVWMTVGFFEVLTDPNPNVGLQKPYKLGAEIGKAQNQNIRHQTFAIVDRTNLIDFPPSVATAGSASAGIWPRGLPLNFTTLVGAIPGKGVQQAVLSSVSGSTIMPLASPPSQPAFWSEGWNLSNKPFFVIDAGTPNEEFVTVKQWINASTFTANFQLPHAAGAPVTIGFNPNKNLFYYQTIVPGNPGPAWNGGATRASGFNAHSYSALVPYSTTIQ